MKKLILLLLFIPLVSFSQIHFGKTKNQIKDIITGADLCLDDENSLMFCASSGNIVGYFFKNNRCVSITFHTKYSTESEAKTALKKEVNAFAQKNNVAPYKKDNMSSTFILISEGVGVEFSFKKTESGTIYITQTFADIES